MTYPLEKFIFCGEDITEKAKLVYRDYNRAVCDRIPFNDEIIWYLKGNYIPPLIILDVEISVGVFCQYLGKTPVGNEVVLLVTDDRGEEFAKYFPEPKIMIRVGEWDDMG